MDLITCIIDKIEDYRRFLNNLYKNAEHKDDNDRNLNIEQNKVIDDIEKEIKKLDSGWIPCSERLPEECRQVLITIRCKNGSLSVVQSSRSDYNYWSGYGREVDVIAWQPLPEPYNEVKTNEL